METKPATISLEEFRRVTAFLEEAVENSGIFAQISEEDQIRFKKAAGRLIHPDKMEIERRNKERQRARHEAKRQADRQTRATTRSAPRANNRCSWPRPRVS